MEAPEVPLEHAREVIEHHAHETTERWIMGVALTAAVLAALAAVTALLAEEHANEAMIRQIQASDMWSHYQADSIKAKVIETKVALLAKLGQPPDADDAKKLAKYAEEKSKIEEEARHLQEESESHLRHHSPLSRGITMFQLAIAVGAISVLTHRKSFWLAAIGLGVAGGFFMLRGLLP
ncbi:MAG: DUF4337 domain-containing protein [Thermoguttaceae bacterium]|jgi:hypothetical protein